MANSVAVLLSYIENILWLCTRAVYSIIFIFEFNYRLVAAFFRSCVQLWHLTIQGVVGMGELVVSTIKFLGNLPIHTYKCICYLVDLSVNAVSQAAQLSVVWCWAKTVWCIQALTTGIWSMHTVVTDVWIYTLESFVDGFTYFSEIFYSFLEYMVHYIQDVRSNTGVVLYNAKTGFQEFLLNFLNAGIDYTCAAINYPIDIVRDIVYSCIEFSENVLKIFMIHINSASTSITNAFYDVWYTLSQIASFPKNVFIAFVNACDEIIFHLYEMLLSLSDGIHESYSSIVEFVVKNWYAIIALSLCFTLLAAVTIYLNIQHDRNIQNALQDLTRLITSFMQSHGGRERGQQAGPDAPPQAPGDLPPQGPVEPPAGNPQEDRRDQDDVVVQRREQGHGDQPGPSRGRVNRRGKYSLRSRPFTPTEKSSGENGSVEGLLKDLKHRLNEEQDRQLCVVCQDAAKNTLFLPCRHLCVCLECAETIIENQNLILRQCPLCRCRIGSVVEVYN